MDIVITPSILNGKITVPPSKSDLQRLILLSAFRHDGKNTKIEIPNGTIIADDVKVFTDAVISLGGKADFCDSSLKISPIEKQKIKNTKIYLGESGAAARFLIPVIAFGLEGSDSITFDGEESLRKRPLTAVADALIDCGFDVSSDTLPLTVKRKSNEAIEKITVDRTVSSQAVSGFLLALSCSDTDGRIHAVGRKSSDGYVSMTLKRLSDFGFDVKRHKSENGEFLTVSKIAKNIPDTFISEGDWSAASFWLCAAHGENRIELSGLDENSLQPDAAVTDCLYAITETTEKKSKVILDIDSFPDIFPPLAAFSAVTEKADVTFIGVERLKFKESNRLSAVCEMINSLGGKAEITVFDGKEALNVKGTKMLRGGTVQSHGDHRIAMSAAILTPFCDGDLIIINSECTDKSYPEFWESYNSIGGKAVCLPISETI